MSDGTDDRQSSRRSGHGKRPVTMRRATFAMLLATTRGGAAHSAVGRFFPQGGQRVDYKRQRVKVWSARKALVLGDTEWHSAQREKACGGPVPGLDVADGCVRRPTLGSQWGRRRDGTSSLPCPRRRRQQEV